MVEGPIPPVGKAAQQKNIEVNNPITKDVPASELKQPTRAEKEATQIELIQEELEVCIQDDPILEKTRKQLKKAELDKNEKPPSVESDLVIRPSLAKAFKDNGLQFKKELGGAISVMYI